MNLATKLARDALAAAGLMISIMTLSAAAAPSYIATPLGSFGGGSYGAAISNRGQVTGWSYTNGNLEIHPFLYADGKMTDLGTLGGGIAYGYAVNNLGQVTGTDYQEPRGPQPLTRAFLYSNGGMTDLSPLLGGGSYSTGNAINDSGHITGVNAAGRAFLYSDGIVTDLGTFGGSQSEGRGINNIGQVTGRADAFTYSHAFIYSAGKLTDLGTLAAGSLSVGNAINDHGQVTGMSDTLSLPPRPLTPPNNASHAFIYSAGKMSDLGTLGGIYSEGTGINAQGQVVGRSETSIPDYAATHAFIYTDGAMQDLNALVVSGLGNAILSEARGINDIGQIVANGCVGDAVTNCRAFRLDPVAAPGGHGGGGCAFISGAPGGPIDPTLPALLMLAITLAGAQAVRSRRAKAPSDGPACRMRGPHQRARLFNFAPPVTEEEIRAASLQFVRKLSGFNKPSKTNEAAFLAAVDRIAAVSGDLLNSLETTAPPRYREIEAAKARERSALRFPR